MNTTGTIDESLKMMLEEKKVTKAVLGDFLAEGIGGVATLILAVLGLAGYSPEVMLSIATVVMGAAFLLEGSAISMRFPRALAEMGKGRYNEELGIGVTAEFLGGILGIILGVLSLIGLARMILVPVAVIAYGSTLVLSSWVILRLSILELWGGAERTQKKNLAYEALTTTVSVEFLFGLSAVVLGIIALTNPVTNTLTLPALLILGVSRFFTATAATSRIMTFFKS